VLTRAARFLEDRVGENPVEHFWIGKTVFRPDTIVAATLYAAWSFLKREEFIQTAEPQMHPASRKVLPPPITPAACVGPPAPARALRRDRQVAYSLSFHYVLTPARRGDLLIGEVAAFVEELIYEMADEYGWSVVEAAVHPDHVYFALETPPEYAPDAVAGIVKEITACESQVRFPDLEKRFKTSKFWDDGYLVWSSGQSLTQQDIEAYLRVEGDGEIVG
jgi:putative transposase